MRKRTKRLLSLIIAAAISVSAVNAENLIGAGLAITAFAEDGVVINDTNFPDATFRKYVSDNFDKDGNGELSASELANATSINVYNLGESVESLKGIEFFTALTDLNCKANKLTELDVSKNTALIKLNCYWNQLSKLDESKNTVLNYLVCESNPLTKLDVSKNTALTTLYCNNNQLTELDVSKNTALTSLSCDSNQLTELDVSKNTELKDLLCSSNQLTKLDVSKNTALEILICTSNQLTELDVSKNTALQCFVCISNQLTELDVSKNTALEKFDCGSNQLTELDVSKNTVLEAFHCDSNQLTKLVVSKNPALNNLNCRENKLTSIDLSNCANAGDLFLISNDNSYTLTSTSLDELTQYGFDPSKASNWTGAEYDAATNSLKNITADKVTYSYDTGYTGAKTEYKTVTFTLVIDIDDNNNYTESSIDYTETATEPTKIGITINGNNFNSELYIMKISEATRKNTAELRLQLHLKTEQQRLLLFALFTNPSSL